MYVFIYIQFTQIFNFVHLMYTICQIMYTILCIHCTKFFNKCTQFYVNNVHKFSIMYIKRTNFFK